MLTVSAKRKLTSLVNDESVRFDPPLQIDYSKACYICGSILPTWTGFCKHRKFQHCLNRYHQLLSPKSPGGSSFPNVINNLVQDSRESFLSDLGDIASDDCDRLEKYAKRAKLPPLSNAFNSMYRYYSMTRYVQGGYNVNLPLSVFLFDLPQSVPAPNGKVVINTPTGSIGDCLQFLVTLLIRNTSLFLC